MLHLKGDFNGRSRDRYSREGTRSMSATFMTEAKLSGYPMQSSDIIERAFELALSSVTIDEVRNALRREGYSNVDAHLAGPSIRSDLKRRFAR